MKNLEIGISETEKGFVVVPAEDYSDMVMSVGALITENEYLKNRVNEYLTKYNHAKTDVEFFEREIEELIARSEGKKED